MGLFIITQAVLALPSFVMRLVANLLWLIFGGLEVAVGYFIGSLALALTVIGLPLAWQTFRLGLLCLWPFGARVSQEPAQMGCLTLLLNAVWILFGGIWVMLGHVAMGLLLCLTLIGIPFGKQHFKLASLSLTPFGCQIRW